MPRDHARFDKSVISLNELFDTLAGKRSRRNEPNDDSDNWCFGFHLYMPHWQQTTRQRKRSPVIVRYFCENKCFYCFEDTQNLCKYRWKTWKWWWNRGMMMLSIGVNCLGSCRKCVRQTESSVQTKGFLLKVFTLSNTVTSEEGRKTS